MNILSVNHLITLMRKMFQCGLCRCSPVKIRVKCSTDRRRTCGRTAAGRHFRQLGMQFAPLFVQVLRIAEVVEQVDETERTKPAVRLIISF